MENSILAKRYSGLDLFKYALPSIAAMIFMSAYGIVDGIFVANLVGEDALAAINIVMPLISVIMAVSLMLATGTNAIMGKFMGEGKYKEARSFLSVIYLVGVIFGAIVTIGCLMFSNEIVAILGASEVLKDYAKDYLVAIVFFAIPIFLQIYTQLYFVTAGKPVLGFVACFMGGITNIGLDYILISEKFFDLGIAGAGIATGIGATVPGLFGLIYFAFNRKGSLYFEKPRLSIRLLGQASYNGMSEMVTQLSTAISTLLFNLILLRIAGEAGVAAISVILYIQMFQIAAYIGFSMGISPIISFKYGSDNVKELKEIIKSAFKYVLGFSVVVILVSVVFAGPLVNIFIDSDSNTFEMTKEGLMIFSIGYLFMGVNVFVSAMFTALSNGKISAVISISRSLVILVICLLTLPLIFGIYGVWIAVPIAEFLSLGVSLYCFKRYRKIYHYA